MKLSEKDKNEIVSLLTNEGFTPSVARLTADVLLEAENSNKSTHGINLLPLIIKRLEQKAVIPNLRLSKNESDSPIVTINCHSSLGYAAAAVASKYGVNLAKKNGVSGILLNNIDHIGALGVYAKRAAKNNCFCLIIAAGKPRVAPWGSTFPVYGTMPIAIGIPTLTDPIVIDTSLSKITVNQLLDAKEKGRNIPNNVAIDKNGDLTSSASEALDGSILPIGDHKGASLIFGLQILLYCLSNCDQDDHPILMVMFDTSKFPVFKENATASYSFINEIINLFPNARIPGMNYNE